MQNSHKANHAFREWWILCSSQILKVDSVLVYYTQCDADVIGCQVLISDEALQSLCFLPSGWQWEASCMSHRMGREPAGVLPILGLPLLDYLTMGYLLHYHESRHPHLPSWNTDCLLTILGIRANWGNIICHDLTISTSTEKTINRRMDEKPNGLCA